MRRSAKGSREPPGPAGARACSARGWRVNRTAHLTDALVLELVTQPALDPPAPAARHLETCARCSADVRELRELVAHERDRDAEPPAALLAGVLALMPPASPRSDRGRHYPVARLVYDSHSALVDMGLRAAATLRHMAWRSEGLAIDAEIEPASPRGGGHLVGQVVPEPPGRAPHVAGDIWLEEPGEDPHWALLDPSGEFALPAPRGRRWSLWLDWGGWRVRVRGS